MAAPILWQFKYSHYSEKVRWALDFKHIAHVRQSLLPGPHLLTLLWRSGQRQVPLLELPGGEIITDSPRIVATLEEINPAPPLYPQAENERARALELAQYFDQELGPALRVAWFQELLSAPELVAEQLAVGFGVLEQSLYRVAFPVIRRIMAAEMGINAENARAARGRVDAALARLEQELQASGYLVGEQFSVADLTAAALWSPLVMPPEFPYPLIRDLPAAAARWRESLIERPGLRWVAEMYHRHRGRSAEVAA